MSSHSPSSVKSVVQPPAKRPKDNNTGIKMRIFMNDVNNLAAKVRAASQSSKRRLRQAADQQDLWLYSIPSSIRPREALVVKGCH